MTSNVYVYCTYMQILYNVIKWSNSTQVNQDNKIHPHFTASSLVVKKK